MLGFIQGGKIKSNREIGVDKLEVTEHFHLGSDFLMRSLLQMKQEVLRVDKSQAAAVLVMCPGQIGKISKATTYFAP